MKWNSKSAWKWILAIFGLCVLIISILYQNAPPSLEESETDIQTEKETPKESLEPSIRLSQEVELVLLAQQKNVPIEFVGVVADSSGLPIPDARVSFSVSRFNISGHSVDMADLNGEVVTSDSGIFQISGYDGYRLSINNIEKSVYKLDSRLRSSYEFSEETKLDFDNSSLAVYTMIKEDEVGELYKNTYKIKSDWDGSVIRFSLKDGDSANKPDLLIRVNRGQLNVRGRRDWSIEMESENGGLILADSYSGSVAPASGYQTSWETNYDAEDENYAGSLDLNLFVKTVDGLFGRVSLIVYADRRRLTSASIIAGVVLNENGTRILE